MMVHSVQEHINAGFYWGCSGYEFSGWEKRIPEPKRGIAHVGDRLYKLFQVTTTDAEEPPQAKIPDTVLQRFAIGEDVNPIADYLAGKQSEIRPEHADFKRVQHMVLWDVLQRTKIATAKLPHLRSTLAVILREARRGEFGQDITLKVMNR